jgi:hypothetical protein
MFTGAQIDADIIKRLTAKGEHEADFVGRARGKEAVKGVTGCHNFSLIAFD